MPRFEPFRGLHYDLTRFDPADVTAPPYDIIDATDRDHLLAQNPGNIVLIDLPQPGDAADPYGNAAEVLDRWRRDGVLHIDDEPTYYVYRMEHTDDSGTHHQMTGVFGALELCEPGSSAAGAQPILPHEHTTLKAKGDRLALLQATATNLSAVWGLSPAKGLTALLTCEEPAEATWTDDDVTHSLWRITDPGRIAAISEAVTAEPVVIADGHHRFETSLAYRNERRAVDGPGGEYDSVMIYMVELAEEQLTVLPIHRLISGLPEKFDLVAAFEPFFEIEPVEAVDPTLLTLVTQSGLYSMNPRPEAMARARDLDSSRLDVALAALPDHNLVFQHGVTNILTKIANGESQAGVLLRPATVTQIIDIAHGGERMPPKTTYFHPKPVTGLVMRDVH